MSTATVPFPAIDVDGPGIPLSRLVRVETRKLVDTRAGFWLLAALAAVTVAVAATVSLWGEKADVGFKGVFGVVSVPAGALLPVLAVLLVTSEWSQRSGLITFLVEPRRSRTIVAKLLVTALLAVVAILGTLLVAWIATVAVRGTRPGAGAWNMPAQFVAYFTAGWIVALFQAFAFGLVFRNSAAGIVSVFAIPALWTLVATVIPALHAHIQPWIDVTSAEAPLHRGEVAKAADWAHLASASAIWILIPFVIGVWRVLRSEVK